MATKTFIMGIFEEEASVLQTLKEMKQSGWRLHTVYSPYPSHAILDSLHFKKSRVGYFTLAGGILGLMIGFGLSIYTAVQWHLIVSGKPIVALIPFFIVGFEGTILFSVLGNIIGLLIQARLPRLRLPEHYDNRFSGRNFGILASCEEGAGEDLQAFFKNHGGKITSG